MTMRKPTLDFRGETYIISLRNFSATNYGINSEENSNAKTFHHLKEIISVGVQHERAFSWKFRMNIHSLRGELS